MELHLSCTNPLIWHTVSNVNTRCFCVYYVHGWPSTQPGSLHTALQRKYTQPCSLFSRGTAVWTMGARLCEQWARLCASARLCRGSPVMLFIFKYHPSVLTYISPCPHLSHSPLPPCYQGWEWLPASELVGRGSGRCPSYVTEWLPGKLRRHLLNTGRQRTKKLDVLQNWGYCMKDSVYFKLMNCYLDIWTAQ